MKILLTTLMLISLTSCFDKKEKKIAELTKQSKEIDQIAYSLGVQYAKSISALEFDDNSVEYLTQGIRDYQSGKLKISKSNTQHLAKKVDAIFSRKRSDSAKSEKEKGSLFVINLLKEDSEWIQAKSGLLYKIIKAGKKIKITSNAPYVDMHFDSFHLDGKQYETTSSGNPKLMPLKGIFKAWLEAFVLAGVGSEIEIIAPPEFTYGDNGARPYIAPGEYLKFNLKFINYYSEKP
jgi:FKBP-type peptidyl-prolyl cis-trans isomerase FkpA